MKSLVLSANDIRDLVTRTGLNSLMDELIKRLTAVLFHHNETEFVTPPRAGFDYNRPHTGLLEWMPAMQHDRQITIKTVGYHPNNPRTYALPTILSTLTRFDTRTGHLVAIADATFMTALRTGAASAVASSRLANPDSSTVGLIGCGAQAVAQLHGLSRVFPIDRVLLFDIDCQTQASFAARCRAFVDVSLDMEFHADQPDRIVADADILCTATSVDVGQGPVFIDGPCKPWLHINAIGSDFPGKTEIPRSVLKRALVCPDFRAQAIHEGECQQLRSDDIGPDIVEILRNDNAEYSYRDQLTVFDSTGWALEDHVAADLLLEHARRLLLGTELEIESSSCDPTDPYAFLTSSRGAVAACKSAPDPAHDLWDRGK